MIQELEKKYWKRFYLLSARAKYVLASVQLDKFENFYNFFIKDGNVIDFKQLNNCGIKTEKGLNFFIIVRLKID